MASHSRAPNLNTVFGPFRALSLFLTVSFSLGCSVSSVEGEAGVGRVGDPCADWDYVACTPDGKQELVCTEGWFELVQECEGGCEVFTVLTDKTLLSCYDEDGNPKAAKTSTEPRPQR